MRASLLNLTMFIMAIMLFSSCVFYEKATPTFDENVEEESRESSKTESRYYYFTEAQIQKERGDLDKAIMYLNQAIEVEHKIAAYDDAVKILEKNSELIVVTECVCRKSKNLLDEGCSKPL